ncbi:MAG: hypothetical protein LH615_10725 [Ferruginibacter sp.]|nr:hypothetical protein [Ferruginibacter sp.]
MKFTHSIIIMALVCYSCTQGLEKTTTENETEKVKKDSLTAIQNYTMDGCYMMTIENDTATMKVTQQQDSMTGSLVYKRDGKDNNIGSVSLVKTSDRVEGWYNYQSEGKTSVRQIVFKTTSNSFAEGYGDIKMNNDTAFFKYPHALNFEEKHRFNKVNCE